MTGSVNIPALVAARYREEVRTAVAQTGSPLRVVGLLATEEAPSKTYAQYTQKACAEVGIEFDLVELPRLALEARLHELNADPEVHGIFVYYPVFGTGQDDVIRDLVDHRKDVEGLSRYWTEKLYANDRVVEGDPNRRAVLPCTPLAIIKILTELGFYASGPSQTASEAASASVAAPNPPLTGLTVSVFNRSEVVGRPLAVMLANDGARVFSFDIDTPLLFEPGKVSEWSHDRSVALRESDVIVTGIPSREFALVRCDEVQPKATCINFSTIRNFEKEVASCVTNFVPRVGPVTVTMCLRNVVRLYENFHREHRA